MRIKIIKADESKVRELELASAFTWEGMNFDDEVLKKNCTEFR